MTRYVQAAPQLPDPYTSDPVLRSYLRRQLGAAGWRRPSLGWPRSARDVTAHAAGRAPRRRGAPADAAPFDAWGARIDRVEIARGLGDAAPGGGRRARAWSRCPTAGGAGDVRVPAPASSSTRCCTCTGRSRPRSPARSRWPTAPPRCCRAPTSTRHVRDAWLPRLLSTDPDTRDHQRPVDDRVAGRLRRRPVHHGRRVAARATTWRLTGEKWFCSAADSAMAVALARPDGRRRRQPDAGPVPRPAVRRRRRLARAGAAAAPAEGQARHPGGADRRDRARRRGRAARSATRAAAAWPG